MWLQFCFRHNHIRVSYGSRRVSGKVIAVNRSRTLAWATPTFLTLGLLSGLILRRINLFWTDRLTPDRPKAAIGSVICHCWHCPDDGWHLPISLSIFRLISQTFDKVLDDQTSLAEGYVQDLKGRVEQDVSSLRRAFLGPEQRLGQAGIARLMQQSADTGSYWHYIFMMRQEVQAII